MRRCYTPGTQWEARYLARGIKVCKRWHAFPKFLEDMGLKPHGKTLDRKNNDGGYSPANCRWATRSEQNRNHSHNKPLTFGGRTQLLSDWAREIGIHKNTLAHRVRHWPLERALSATLQQGRKP